MTGRTLGHCRIVEKLGACGMGVVYKAQDIHLDRSVALKALPPESVSDPRRNARFVQEAKAASAVDHPNIVHICRIDESDSGAFGAVTAPTQTRRGTWVVIAVLAVVAVLGAAGWLWVSRSRNAAPQTVLAPVPPTSFPGRETSRSGRREVWRIPAVGTSGPDGAIWVTRIFASWNQLDGWLRQVEALRRTA
jgi:hypothetical protein